MSKIRLRVRFTGGLGNQIFQYLASKYLCEILPDVKITYEVSSYISEGYRDLGVGELINEKLIISEANLRSKGVYRGLSLYPKSLVELLLRAYHLSKGDLILSEDIASKCFKGSPLASVGSYVARLEYSSYRKRVEKNIVIDGYWQDLKPYVDKGIAPYPPERLWHRYNMPEWSIPNEYIAIHVRRGDYIDNKTTYEEFGCAYDTLEYIRCALSLIPASCREYPLLVVTDDPYWCGEWIGTSITEGFPSVFMENSSAIRDWLLLSNARVNIVSNSTFSLTAAYLNKANKEHRLRCLMPKMYSTSVSTSDKNWNMIQGSITI
jgi:hypothetical protein